MAGRTMRPYDFCAGFCVGLLICGGVAAPVVAQTIGNPLWDTPIKSLRITRERPVFSPSRRPPPPVAVAPAYVPPRPPAKPASPQLVLLGTVLNAINTVDGIGVFLDETNSTVVRLKAGDHHNGWLLWSVQGREATLRNDRDTVVLVLPVRGIAPTGAFNANTSLPVAQPVPASQGKSAQKFQLEKYD